MCFDAATAETYHIFCSYRFVSKLNPRRVLYESKGDTIVSLMYAAAGGDISNLRR